MKDFSFHSFQRIYAKCANRCTFFLIKRQYQIIKPFSRIKEKLEVWFNLWHCWNLRWKSTISTSYTFWNTFKNSSQNNSHSLPFHKIPSSEILSLQRGQHTYFYENVIYFIKLYCHSDFGYRYHSVQHRRHSAIVMNFHFSIVRLRRIHHIIQLVSHLYDGLDGIRSPHFHKTKRSIRWPWTI